ncbi:MAG: 2-oxo-4-hydroxy-4-carboxy-5-ureidoimidazoline decarboxylase [Pseudomonadota bacterium]
MNRYLRPLPSGMKREHFVAEFGGIYEHSAWVAEQAFDAGLDAHCDTAAGLAERFQAIVDGSNREQRLELIRAHPDLAGKAAVAGNLTASSTSEQASAGLDRCTPHEFDRFQQHNDAYKARFDMPFIKAVRHSNRAEILTSFEARLPNSFDDEFDNAMQEIHQIARWRLEALCDG